MPHCRPDSSTAATETPSKCLFDLPASGFCAGVFQWLLASATVNSGVKETRRASLAPQNDAVRRQRNRQSRQGLPAERTFVMVFRSGEH
ncbi:hypothetical protein BaRGS_00026652 [Batillaria attramentaria]|uniref:Uncharacterized protein n=1 Tax=Batillaria attramentaria TaxID=370345 RepID=A0ABD0K5D6_9CAEN